MTLSSLQMARLPSDSPLKMAIERELTTYLRDVEEDSGDGSTRTKLQSAEQSEQQLASETS